MLPTLLVWGNSHGSQKAVYRCAVCVGLLLGQVYKKRLKKCKPRPSVRLRFGSGQSTVGVFSLAKLEYSRPLAATI